MSYPNQNPQDPSKIPPPPPGAQPLLPPAPSLEDAVRSRGYKSSTQVQLAVLILGLFVASLLYRQFILGGLMPWSLFFHGLSAVLALALVALGPRGSLSDRVFLGTTIALLMAGTVAGEGAICVLMVAPFVYLFVFLAAYSGHRGSGRTMAIAPVIFLASMASGLQPADIQQTTATVAVAAAPGQVEARLAATPDIPAITSGLLGGIPRASFPQPVDFAGEGLVVGDQRSITFTDGGELVLEVTDAGPGRVTFVPVSDTTVIGNWAPWRQATFSWAEGLDETTEVTLDIYYRRLLEPGWYFGPIVDLGMDQATDHLLHHLVVEATNTEMG